MTECTSTVVPAEVMTVIRVLALRASRSSVRFGDFVEDVTQDLLLRYVQQRYRYDPGRSSVATFAARVCGHCAIVMLAKATAQKRGGGVSVKSLSEPVAIGQAVVAVQNAVRMMVVPAAIHAGFQGTAQVFQDYLATEPYLILAALVTVYIVLGILYENYVHPITILSTLPSAGVGALLALLIFRTELSIIALIGIILLIGIVKKNAILMIDFAIEAERNEGNSPEKSIYQACLLRFRPIMMTTMAAIFGGIPIALGGGNGSELRRPLGIAIVGGLMVSQMLTLYTTPVVYLYMDRFRAWVSGGKALRPLEDRRGGNIPEIVSMATPAPSPEKSI
jgi:hypothetical protein